MKISDFIFLTFFLLSGCTKDKECGKIEYVDFSKDEEKPLIFITRIISKDCPSIYGLKMNFSNKSINIDKEYKMIFEDSIFKIKTTDKYESLLNLKCKSGDFYTVHLVNEKKDYYLKIESEENILHLNKMYYVFRFKNVFNYFNHSIDAVIFCTKKEGIIGSFYTSSDKKEKIMIRPIGNILNGIKDYNNYEKRELL